jgi:hypothetical protein
VDEAQMHAQLTVIESADFALERALRTADVSEPATLAMLREAARVYADRATARKEPPERVVDAVVRIAGRAGVEASRRDGTLVKAVAWCVERYVETAGATSQL